MKRLIPALALALLIALPSHAGVRWLVYKVKDGRLQTRSNEVWSGLKPEPGKNIPADAAVRMMPTEPRGAKPADFVRTSTSVVYEPEQR